MHAVSREALRNTAEFLNSRITEGGTAMAAAAQTGTELFDVVEVLDDERGLRVAVADVSAPAAKRSGLAQAVFGGKVSETTADVLRHAVEAEWSTPRELRSGLVELGRRSLLLAAKESGQLQQVESELYQLGRLLAREPELTRLLEERKTDRASRRDLLARVLYGKVTSVTEALALQAVGRPERGVIDDMTALARVAADMQGHDLAAVTAATELNDDQRTALAAKLERIYGREMSIHTEVDPSLLGGMVIRVGDEVIDGSTSGKLEKMRHQFA